MTTERKHKGLPFLLLIPAALGASCGSSSAGRNEPQASPTPTVAVTQVVSQQLHRDLRLPGDLTAYQDVALFAKVAGFVESIRVDRGSTVRRGELLVKLVAPELASQRGESEAKARASTAQLAEAEAKILGARAQTLEAEAKLQSDEATYRRLKAASATPGAVAGNDVDVAGKTVEADRARVELWKENEKAAKAQVNAFRESSEAAAEGARSVASIESYLRVTAPFDGVVTERNVHAGSLVGPAAGSTPMLRVQQLSRLRLTVAVPETSVAGVSQGAKVKFTVAAFPGQTFAGTVSRIARVLDARTRTMPVELDVVNTGGRLAAGMYAEVAWPAGRAAPSLFVPTTAVATTTERSFIVRIRGGVVEWIDVRRGMSMGNLIEVFGELAAGDVVALRGTDELRAGTKVQTKPASTQ